MPEQVVTAVQLAAFVVVEKFTSSVHAEQTRFVVEVAAVLMYSPAAQAVNEAHVRSLDTVGAAVWYSVPLQVVTALQLPAFVVVEKFVPSVQEEHSRFVVDVAAVLMYWPGTQSVKAAQVRSLDTVGAAV